VKARSRIQDTDLSGLRLLRDRLGERFVAGFLLNLGELAYRKEERIMVMPLSGLWSSASRKNPTRSVSLSFARRAVAAHADIAVELGNGPR
jgi:hypothetical protein